MMVFIPDRSGFARATVTSSWTPGRSLSDVTVYPHCPQKRALSVRGALQFGQGRVLTRPFARYDESPRIPRLASAWAYCDGGRGWLAGMGDV
jgi:hypothetical protein